MALGGSGASTAASGSSAKRGCSGVVGTAKHHDYLLLFGGSLTISEACRELGPPDRISAAGGRVVWRYGPSRLVFIAGQVGRFN